MKADTLHLIEPVWGIDNHLTTFFKLTYFELILTSIGILISSILLTLRIDLEISNITALIIFLPIYVADALCITLVFIKYQHKKHWKNKDDSGDDGASLKQLVQTFFYRMMLFLVKYLMQQTLENWLRGDNDNEANYFALISSLLLCLLSARRAYSEVKVGIGKKE